MKLTISLQVTLDGVGQAGGGNNQEMDPGFTRGGWALPLNDAEAVQDMQLRSIAVDPRTGSREVRASARDCAQYV